MEPQIPNTEAPVVGVPESKFMSRQFWVLLLDTIVSLILFFAGKYAAPDALDSIKFFIVTMQPVCLFVIGAFTYDDRVKTQAALKATELRIEDRKLDLHEKSLNLDFQAKKLTPADIGFTKINLSEAGK